MNILRGRDDTAGWAGVPFRVPGKATGGRISDIPGFASGGQPGGRIPYPAPANMAMDNVLGLVNGKPVGLQGQEWIINGYSSTKHDRLLGAINRDEPWLAGLTGFARGGTPVREYLPPHAEFAPPSSSGQGPLTFTGNLYLDSGEFLGRVRSASVEAVGTAIDSSLSRVQRGGVYSGKVL